MKSFTIYLITAVLITLASCTNKNGQAEKENNPSVMIMRFRADHTLSEEKWNEVYAAISKYPECCDEVWFSTGLGYPSLENHRKHAEILKKGSCQLKSLGIKSSIQIQMTIGHGDGFNQNYDSLYFSKEWGGWTGSTGIVDTCCSCPRQSKFIEYIKQMTAIYAENKPDFIWVDDDLRYDNHSPATINSHIGCWCDTCIAAFNLENSSSWTRETLSKAIEKDQSLMDKWKDFSICSITNLARVITNQIHEISPKTKMGLQSTSEKRHIELSTAILKTMNAVSGLPVGSRPGGGAYYDTDPSQLVIKSISAADFRKQMGNPDYIDTWCPEIESYPRTYESRTAQSVMVEGFTALAYGLNSISYFITSGVLEEQKIYIEHYYKPLSEGREMLKSYAKENENTIVVGYSIDASATEKYAIGMTGIPLLVGVGKSIGTISKEDIFRYTPESPSTEIENNRKGYGKDILMHTFASSSKEIQGFRDTLNTMMQAPAVCCSPFYGHVIQRVDKETGNLKNIGLINTRVDYQYNIRIKFNGTNIKAVKWHELKKSPVNIPIEKENGHLYATIPSIFPWSVGYLSVN